MMMINSKSVCILTLALLATHIGVRGFSVESTSTINSNRRDFLSKALISTPVAIAAASGILLTNPANANASITSDLVDDLRNSITKIDAIPELLDQGEWDKVRTILKTPPVNKLWNLGESKNTLSLLAKETGEFELLELKDDLAISLQICDQLTYDNAFVYFQPGNGKVEIKQPKALANKATSQIQDAIKLVNP